MNEVLSQEEVDALLLGMPGDETDDAADAVPAGAMRGYDLTSQERIVRARLPALDIIMERFARRIRSGLTGFLQKTAEVAVGAVEVKKYGTFLRELVVPTNFNVVAVRPLRGSGLIVCEPALVFAVIDALFGGSGKYPVRIEGREFSATEQRIIARLVDLVCTDYAQAWSGVYPIELAYQRSEMQPQFATIATPGELVVCCSVTVEIGEATGTIHICIPYATLEPIRDLLGAGATADAGEPDARWVDLLKTQIQSAEVELVAELAHAPATVEQLLAFKPGDFIELDLCKVIEAKVAGVPLLDCQYGTSNGRYALKVDRLLDDGAAGWLSGRALG